MLSEEMLVNRVREAFIKAVDRFRLSNFKYCMRAGACSYVCHFWLTEPRHDLVPGIKGKRFEDVFNKEFSIHGKILLKIFKRPLITREELEIWRELSYGYCSLCDRCRLACPYSLEFPPLTLYMRYILHEVGLTPDSLKSQIENEFRVGHPYGFSKEDWLKFIDDLSSKVDGDVPVDKKGAKILVVPGKGSLIDNPQSFISTIRILAKVGEDFTLSSDLWTICMSTWDIGAWEDMRKLTLERFKKIRELEIKTLLITNDGCGYYGWRWEASKLIGGPLNFNVLDLTELLAKYLVEKKIDLDPKANNFRATYHDPCHLARKSGIIEEPRKVIRKSVKDFVEMPHHGIYSVCCTAGCLRVEEYRNNRLKAFKVKLEEIKATDAEAVVTACDECFFTIKNFLRDYGEEIEVIDIATLVERAMK